MAKKNGPDIMGLAMLDYFHGKHKEDIITYSSISGEDVLPVAHLFRNFDQMPLLEQIALSFDNVHVKEFNIIERFKNDIEKIGSDHYLT